jgi:hypothetical protein
MHDDPELQRKFASILPNLDERQRRLLAAAEARSLGYGGIRRVSRASGISHTTIRRALEQLDAPPPPTGHVRRPGGGRKRVRDKSPAILAALEGLIAPETRGDPMSPPAVDLQEHSPVGRGPGPTGVRRQPPRRRRVAPSPRLQPPGQCQDARGEAEPRPRRPVPVHQPDQRPIHRRRVARHLRGHQEEGTKLDWCPFRGLCGGGEGGIQDLSQRGREFCDGRTSLDL